MLKHYTFGFHLPAWDPKLNLRGNIFYEVEISYKFVQREIYAFLKERVALYFKA